MPTLIDKSKIQILFSKEEIAAKVSELAATVSRDYTELGNLVIVGVLKGAFIFTADLVRELSVPCDIEFIRLSSYHQGTESSGDVKAYDLTLPDLSGKNVLIIEDIIDSGRTAQFLHNFFTYQSKASSVKIAALFNKPCKRISELKDLQPDYACFEIDDKFILGYGLDYEQKFRELPYVGYVN
jgi:hypoxanthine phosphoribosyltransferase